MDKRKTTWSHVVEPHVGNVGRSRFHTINMRNFYPEVEAMDASVDMLTAANEDMKKKIQELNRFIIHQNAEYRQWINEAHQRMTTMREQYDLQLETLSHRINQLEDKQKQENVYAHTEELEKEEPELPPSEALSPFFWSTVWEGEDINTSFDK